MPKTRTPTDFLAALRDSDMTVADWCRAHGFSQQLAYRVLNGRSQGRWGEARRIVKKMGLQVPDMPAGGSRRTTTTATA